MVVTGLFDLPAFAALVQGVLWRCRKQIAWIQVVCMRINTLHPANVSKLNEQMLALSSTVLVLAHLSLTVGSRLIAGKLVLFGTDRIVRLYCNRS